MRILVADKNALFLTAVSATFGRHCELVTATCRDLCMDHVERQRFDVVIACEKLADYSGLELLSEVASVSPGTLRVFAASPEQLERLANRLEVFGLFETISYPLTPRKLLETLKRARQNLPRRAPMKVRHVVLDSDADTGERLALIEHELRTPADPGAPASWIVYETAAEMPPGEEDPVAAAVRGVNDPCDAVIEISPAEIPVIPAHSPDRDSEDPMFEVMSGAAEAEEAAPADLAQEPQWDDSGAANDSIFEPTAPAAQSYQSPDAGKPPQPRTLPEKSSGTANAKAARESRARIGAQPRVRAQANPTAAQRAAFERALARRKAEKTGAAQATGGNGDRRSGRMGTPSPANQPDAGQLSRTRSLVAAARSTLPTGSLSELARMAAGKRPLAVPNLDGSGQKRAAFALGSGMVAVILLGVLGFELLRRPSTAEATPHVQAAAANTQLFGPTRTLVANTEPQPFSAPSFTPSPQQPPPDSSPPPPLPQPQAFDPESAPPDPPPPPPQAYPGPMEPPSSDLHGRGVPLGMVPPGFQPRPEEEEETKGWNE